MNRTSNVISHRRMFFEFFSSVKALSTRPKPNQAEVIYKNENIIVISNNESNSFEKTSTFFKNLAFFLFKYSFSREDTSYQTKKQQSHNFDEYDVFAKNSPHRNIDTSNQFIIFFSDSEVSFDQVRQFQKILRENIAGLQIIVPERSQNNKNKKNMMNENDNYWIKTNRARKKSLQSWKKKTKIVKKKSNRNENNAKKSKKQNISIITTYFFKKFNIRGTSNHKHDNTEQNKKKYEHNLFFRLTKRSRSYSLKKNYWKWILWLNYFTHDADSWWKKMSTASNWQHRRSHQSDSLSTKKLLKFSLIWRAIQKRTEFIEKFSRSRF